MLSHFILVAILTLRGYLALHPYTEWAVAVERNGKVHCYSDSEFSSDHIKVDGDTVLIGHTHPDGTDPYPSPEDIALSKKIHIPDVVVSTRANYLVGPDGQVEQVK